MKKVIIGLTKEELKTILQKNLFEKSYRVSQIINWIYKKSIDSFEKMTDLPLETRKILKENFSLDVFKDFTKDISKIDATTRYNFTTYDGYIVPAVYIPKLGRNVICISTQIGCSIGCSFCNSGKISFKRNLTTPEIVGEVLYVQRDLGKINNILFMGMGEPLLNYENLVSSIKIFTSEDMFAISRRKITVSTVGLVPVIYRMIDDKIGINLAVSLHSFDDNKRKKVIQNLNFSVDEIIEAAVKYSISTKTKLTIEYVLIKDFNDSIEDAKGLTKLFQKHVKNKSILKVNLIPFNFVETKFNYSAPNENTIDLFKQLLIKNGYMTFVRKPHGVDIGAGCGQLGY